MKKLMSLGLLLGSLECAAAQPQLLGFDWKNSAGPGTSVVLLDGVPALKVENTNGAPLTARLMTATNPPVTEMFYAVVGEVKYESVHGNGYLEIWSFFPPLKPRLAEGQYFSRTLADTGEMGKISGSSDWRKFSLPFDRTGASGPPTRLEINLVLPGSGTVYLRPAKLGKAVAWWSPRQAGQIGGIGGSVCGCFGALIGVLAGCGRARRLVLTLTTFLVMSGIVLLIAGVIAVAQQQPYAVFYPLLLGGVILTAVFGVNLPMMKRRYNELEIRRMTSMDATGI